MFLADCLSISSSGRRKVTYEAPDKYSLEYVYSADEKKRGK
jgi:hypothetical protein